jgi:alpha-1,3-mannosyltransferase
MKRTGCAVLQAAVLFSICSFLLIPHLWHSSDEVDFDDTPKIWHSNFGVFNETPSASISPEAALLSLYTTQILTDTAQETTPPLPETTPFQSTFSSDEESDGGGHSEETRTASTTTEAASSTESPATPTTNRLAALSTGSPELFDKAARYVQAIMSPENVDFARLACPAPTSDRYDYLKVPASNLSKKPKYFFALDLYQSAHILPRLLGSVVEAIRFLGPQSCVLSVLEGRSTDGTFEILTSLEAEMDKLGVKFILQTSDINPLAGEGTDRIKALADLRNEALTPLYNAPTKYDVDTTVIFINDVALCTEDILELVHQRAYQKADMTCAMDWINDASNFYDVWISRQMNGDLFFEIAQNAGWEYSQNLLWNDPESRDRLDHGRPFQVFACWNGATVFTARPLMQQKVRFRSNREGECYLGEPVHFCKDLWKEGYGKIAVVPSVNVGYSDEQSMKVKEWHGRVSAWAEKEDPQKDLIEWDLTPPKHIKCVTSYQHPSWERWNQ